MNLGFQMMIARAVSTSYSTCFLDFTAFTSSFSDPTEGCHAPLLNETAEVLRDLRQRIKSMTIVVSLDDEENSQSLRDVIAPHDEWRQQTGEDWHSHSIGPSVQAGVRDTNRQGCRIEKL